MGTYQTQVKWGPTKRKFTTFGYSKLFGSKKMNLQCITIRTLMM